MPIGIALGGAAIAGVAGIAGSAISAGAQQHAAQTAADSSLQAAELNNQLYRDIYNQNLGVLGPYAQGGLPAMYELNGLLGLPSAPAGALGGYAPMTSGYQTAPTYAQTPTGNGLSALGSFQRGTRSDLAVPTTGPAANNTAAIPRPGADSRSSWLASANAARGVTTTPPSTAPGSPTGSAGALAAMAPKNPGDAFNTFRNSTNYKWRLNEGEKALNSQWAAHGALDSGAASKAIVKFGQNFASNELSNYMNLLAGQQAMGLSAAGAVAGVGTSYAGNVAAQNTNAANAAANAALMSGQAQAGMWGGIGQGIGQLGGALYQYGTGQMQPQTSYAPAGSIAMNPNPSPGAGQVYNWGTF